MPNLSKVSVIIPVYNVENHLEDCLDSVINQTLKDIEIICIDDGSTDGSLDILEKFAQKDDRIKIINQENQGAGAARNKGLKIAQGEYLSFLDADDFFELDMLEKVYEYSMENSLDIAVYGVQTFNDKTSEVKEIGYDIQRKYLPNKFIFTYKDFPMYVFNTFKNWTWNKLFKRSFILKNDIEFQELFRTNDLLFTCKALVKAERISVLDTPLVYYRVGHDFHSQITNHEHPLDFYNAMIALKSFLIDENIFHQVEQSFVNFAASGCLYNLKSLNTKESHEKLYNFLYDEGLEQLSISGKPDDYFYDRNLLKIKEIEKQPMLKPSSKPRVSIIIPTYNVETYLEECLDSIVNQTLRDIEIICVNDGSTDGSLSILEEYEKKDDRIKIISKPNSGYGHTMNVGIDAATGEYIGIVEPDDYVALDMYEILYNEAVKNDLDLIKADFYRFTETGKNIKKTYEKVAREDSNYNRVINPQNELQVFRFIMNTWTGIYKRDFIEKYNIRHNETPGASFQDNGFWFQTLAFATRTYFLNKPFYMNRRDNQDSSVHDKGKVFAMCEEHDFMRDILDNSPKLKENPEFKEELIYVYQRKRFNSYVFTLNRIGPEFYKMFLEKFHEDYVQAADNNELKEELFYEKEWDFLQRVIKDPASVKESDFKIFSNRSSANGLISKKRKLDKLLSFLYILKKQKLNPKKIYRIYKARGQLKSLNLFDEGYYLNNYPDVKKSNINPLDHYLCIGWMEKRTPSKKFNGNYYLRKYSDVKRSNFNPLVHYVRHGKREGRFPSHQAEINSPQNKIKKLERKINQQNRKINTLKREMRKYTRVYTVGHINKEKVACEIELFKGLGVTQEKRSPHIIVSLTSFPDRIYDIHYCLYSLLIQSFKPDRLILWLSKDEFPNLEEELPSNVLNLKNHGLEIKWTEENFRSYDKLIHSLKEYPNDFIVTADDDLFYPEDWLEKLYENYDGKNVIAHRAHLISFESGSPKPYRQWEKSTENDEISFLNFPTTGGGVLYPPNVFYRDVLKDELFSKLSPKSDDIWFWTMLVLNNKKVKIIKNGYKVLIYINPERELNLNKDRTLYKNNKLPTGNDESVSAILEYYPEIKDKLLEEIGFDKIVSKNYWENRYKQGNNSGVGSYGFLADFKAFIINDFVKSHDVRTVIEFGHGDGNQLKLANYKEYMGFDVSKTAVELCREIFKEDRTKSFYLLEEYDNQKADLTLSLDVIYHLIEDNIFEEYMERLFNASDRHVIIYSSNTDEMKDKAKHVKHRKFTDWIEKKLTNWKLIDVIKNKYPFNGNFKEGSFSDFYFYEKVSAPPSEYCPETEDKLVGKIPPDVSVIIPVYNREKYLKPCLDSVINQTLKNIEIICINDGSTDGSLKILEEYGRKDGRIKIIDQKNQGPGLARTIGLKIAKGEYIGFVDSDDWIDLNFYEKLFTEAKKQDADLTRTLYVFESQGHSKEMPANKTIIERESKGEPLNVNEHSVVIWNAIYKREYLQKNNVKFDNLQGVVDVPFTAKATYYSKKTIPVTGTYYHFRTEVENKVTTFNKKRIEEMLKANKITLDFINSVKYENKTDYLVAFKRVIWRYDDIFGRGLKLDYFDNKDQESYFNEVVQGFQSCKYKEDLVKDYSESYFEFLEKDSFNEYLKYKLQKD